MKELIKNTRNLKTMKKTDLDLKWDEVKLSGVLAVMFNILLIISAIELFLDIICFVLDMYIKYIL